MDSMKHDDKNLKHVSSPQSDAAESNAPQRPAKGRVRRMLRWTAFGMAGLLGLVTVSAGGTLLFLRSDSGERWLTSVINDAMTALPSGLSGSIEAFRGPLPGAMHVEGLRLRDKGGEWLTAQRATVRIDWGALPTAFVIAEISADDPVLLRAPELEPAPEPEQEAEPSASPQEMLAQFDDFLKNWPSWLPELRVDELALRSAEVRTGPYPFKAGLHASASAGRKGIEAKIGIQREDGSLPAEASNRRSSLAFALTPGLDLLLDAQLADMGFASAFLPKSVASQPAFELSLQGKSPLQNWKASLEGSLRDDAAKGGSANANTILALAGSMGLRPLAKSPAAEAMLKVDSGALASRFWKAVGQKDGRLSLKLTAEGEAGAETRAATSLDIALSDMQWGSAMLDALLGRNVSAGTSASLQLGKNGELRADLKKFSTAAAHVGAEASGSVVLAGGDIAHAGSRADIDAAFSLKDAAQLSPEISGELAAQASLSGPFRALAAEAALKGSQLATTAVKLRDMDVLVKIPSADIAALAGLASSQKKDLLDGSAQATLFVNEQPVSLASNWSAENSGKTIRFLLNALDLQTGGNSITGELAAVQEKTPKNPAKGSIAEMAGTALPSLTGRLDISLPDWDSLAALSGIPMSGSPLQAHLVLKDSGRQDMDLSLDLPSFKIHAAEQDVELSGLRTSIRTEDIWGRPAASVLASFVGAKVGKMSFGETTLNADGGLDAVDLALQSKGGLESDIKAHWKPGEVQLDVLEARIQPDKLGLPEGPAVGLALAAPASMTYGSDSVTVRDLSADLLPAGKLDVSGRFSTSHMDGRLALKDLALENYRHLVRGLPAGNVELLAEFSGKPQSPSGNFKLNLKDIVVPGTSLPPVDSELSGKLSRIGNRRVLQAAVDIPEKTQKSLGLTRFVCNADVPFTSPAEGVSMPDMKGPIKAELSLGGQIEGLWKLVPSADQRLSGLVDIDASVSGPLKAPVVTAHAAVKDGSFRDIMQGVELRGIQLKVDADKVDMARAQGKRVTLELVARDARKGTVELGGWLDPASLALDIKGSMQKLSPLRRPDIRVQLSGDIDVTGTAQSPLVKADITVDKGEVSLAKLPGGSIPTLEIWTPEEQKKADEAPAVPGHLDVKVNIPNQFFVRGYGLDCEWGGRLRIDAPLTKPAVRGSLKAVRGTLDILGKNFKLAEGEIRFDGGWPVSPLLNIDMEYVASSITADIIVGGTASDPKLSLTSQPEMPQDEILSQIMFGQSSGNLSHAQAIQLASGAASLAGFGGAGVMDFGRKLLGVDVFKLNSDNDGEDSDVSRTSLEMGTYVRDNVYVGVEQGVGKESDTGAVVEIELLPTLEFRAKASGNDTEVGLEWKKNY